MMEDIDPKVKEGKLCLNKEAQKALDAIAKWDKAGIAAHFGFTTTKRLMRLPDKLNDWDIKVRYFRRDIEDKMLHLWFAVDTVSSFLPSGANNWQFSFTGWLIGKIRTKHSQTQNHILLARVAAQVDGTFVYENGKIANLNCSFYVIDNPIYLSYNSGYYSTKTWLMPGYGWNEYFGIPNSIPFFIAVANYRPYAVIYYGKGSRYATVDDVNAGWTMRYYIKYCIKGGLVRPYIFGNDKDEWDKKEEWFETFDEAKKGVLDLLFNLRWEGNKIITPFEKR